MTTSTTRRPIYVATMVERIGATTAVYRQAQDPDAPPSGVLAGLCQGQLIVVANLRLWSLQISDTPYLHVVGDSMISVNGLQSIQAQLVHHRRHLPVAPFDINPDCDVALGVTIVQMIVAQATGEVD